MSAFFGFIPLQGIQILLALISGMLGLVGVAIFFWLGYRVLICPVGYEEHRTLDVTGKILIVVQVLIFVSLVVAVITIAIPFLKKLRQEHRARTNRVELLVPTSKAEMVISRSRY